MSKEIIPNSSHPQINALTINSFQSIELGAIQASQPSIILKSQQQVKNRRWEDEEHILYIIFLEQNRQKIKSKLIRRSNSFFKEMATFIETKSSTQCLSYHQKYEIRYKYPHRIIREQREKVNQDIYKQLYSKIKEIKKSKHPQKNDASSQKQRVAFQKQPKQTHSFQCQTDLQGVSTVFIVQDYVKTESYRQLPQSIPYYTLPVVGMPVMNNFYGNQFYWQ